MTGANHASRTQEHSILDGIFFAALTLLITWGTGMLVVLSNHANLVNGAMQVRRPIFLPFPIAIALVMLGAFGPFLAAIVVTSVSSWRPGVRKLLSQFRRWRVRPVWFITAFLGPALLGLVALSITALLGWPAPAHWFALPRPVLFAGWSSP